MSEFLGIDFDQLLKYGIGDAGGNRPFKQEVEVYNVLDDEGNVESQQRYAQGSSMYNQVKADQEAGRETYVFKSNRPGSETYTMAGDAKFDVDIDPVAGRITVDGPSWLTSEIINSDSFKQNYSENKTLLSAVNAFRKDPNAKFADDKNGNSISAADMIGQFEDMASNYANSYVELVNAKDTAKKRYGVNWTDEDVYMANTFYDKKDYDKNGRVYLTNKLIDKFGSTIRGLNSWDEGSRSISTEDFFTKLYDISLSDNEGTEVRKEALAEIEDLLEYNNYDHDDDSYSERNNEISSSEYASEAARAVHVMNLLKFNSAETTAAVNFMLGAFSTANSFAQQIQDGGLSLAAWGTEVADSIVDIFPGEGQQAAGTVLSPVYLASWLVGELMSIPSIYSDVDGLGETFTQIMDDVEPLLSGDMVEVWDARRQEIDTLYGEFKEQYSGIAPDAWAIGDFVGTMGYKMFENIALLETAGKLLTKPIALLGKSASPVAKAMSKILPAKNVTALFNATAWTANNVLVQGVLETFIDDRDLMKKAMADGELSSEAWGAIKRNMMWNFVGGLAGWGTGKGLSAALPWLVKNTSSAKVAAMVGWKVSHKAASYYDSILHKLFKSINNGDWTLKATDKAVGSEAVGRQVTSLYKAEADISNALKKTRIFAKTDPEIVNRIQAGWDAIDPERNIYASIAEKVNGQSPTAKAVAELQEGKGFRSVGKGTSFDQRITENYINMSRVVLAKANLQNQFDLISKGAFIRMSEINNYAGSDFTNYNKTLNDVKKIETNVKGLTYSGGESGYILSKESSNWMSYESQYLRYNSRVEAGAEAFDNPAQYKAWTAYRDACAEKLAELEAKLGPELTRALDEHLAASAKYIEAIDNFMIMNGYYDAEYAKWLVGLRNSGDWNGADGRSRFIHTARVYDSEKKTFETLQALDNPQMFTRKVAMDEPQAYKPGDTDYDFMDPTLVTYMYLHSAGAVAQGQEWTRALYATGVMAGKIEKFGDDGTSKLEASVITKDVKKMGAEYKEIFSPKSIQEAVRAAYKDSGVIEVGYKASRVSRGTDVSKATKTAKTAKRNIEKQLKEATKEIDKRATEIFARATIQDVDNIINDLPADVNVPNFDIGGLKAGDYEGWLESLPNSCKKFVLKRLKETNYASNVTNLKKLVREDPNFMKDLKTKFINDSSTGVKKTEAFKNNIRRMAQAEMTTTERATLGALQEQYAKAVDDYNKAVAADENFEVEPGDPKSYGEEFVNRVTLARGKIVDNIIEKLRGQEAFQATVDKMVAKMSGFSETEARSMAERYVALYHLNKMKEAAFENSLESASSSAAMVGGNNMKAIKGINKTVAKGIKDDIKSQFDMLQAVLGKESADLIDVEEYFKEVQAEVNRIESIGLKYDDKLKQIVMDDAGKRKLLQMVDNEGNLRWYQVDPLYATLANFQPNYRFDNNNAIEEWLLKANGMLNQVFRWGTTGIDKVSYLNQWSRDSINATKVAAGSMFSDLTPTRPGVAFIRDFVPFGEKIFGKTVTERFTTEFVDDVFDSSETALKELFGEEYVQDIFKSSTEGLTGNAAKNAYKRAVVERYIGETGYEALPNIGAMTEAKFYRTATDGGKPEAVTPKELRQEYYASLYKEDPKAWKQFGEKLNKTKQRFNDLIEDTSKGQWRETYWRKNIYARSYKNAVKAGCTGAEAKIFATRYALDATTDFARAFAFGNRFIKSVPYLGASINGMKSFMRLMELDPLGITTRIATGVILPYMALLSETLSDPKNREAYKNIPEYEKQDSIVFAYNGAVIKIPFPQEISSVLSPFRHMIEKSADVQDISWARLIASDVLSLSPIDLSGFVELDENDILTDAEDDNGLGINISRGVEKAFSAVMMPSVRAAYMVAFKRDPYTGRNINTSYTTVDDEGNEVVMDSTQSAIAKDLGKLFPNLSASGAYAVTKALFGRSTMSVLDGAKSAIFDGVVPEDALDTILSGSADAIESVFTVQRKQQSVLDWAGFQRAAYEKKKELINDDGFKSAYRALQTNDPDSEKYKGALRTYKEKLDEYTNFVLKGTQSFKGRYPDSYTTNRAAQVISMLTLDTGTTLNETAYSAELRSEQFYDAKNAAVDTFVRMGFPQDYAGNTLLGTGYFDKNDGNKFKFKVFTPYQIQALSNDSAGTAREIQAQIRANIENAGIEKEDMWAGYYKANNKAERKAYKADWNAKVVIALEPIIDQYGVETVLTSGDTVDVLDNYLFIDNPYKSKQYLRRIFGGSE